MKKIFSREEIKRRMREEENYRKLKIIGNILEIVQFLLAVMLVISILFVALLTYLGIQSYQGFNIDTVIIVGLFLIIAIVAIQVYEKLWFYAIQDMKTAKIIELAKCEEFHKKIEIVDEKTKKKSSKNV